MKTNLNELTDPAEITEALNELDVDGENIDELKEFMDFVEKVLLEHEDGVGFFEYIYKHKKTGLFFGMFSEKWKDGDMFYSDQWIHVEPSEETITKYIEVTP